MSVEQKSFDTFKPDMPTAILASIAAVEKRFGISPLRQMQDIVRLSILGRRITPQDYYRLRVFAVPDGDPGLQADFIGDRQITRLNFAISDRRLMRSLPIVQAKDVHWGLMKAAGIPVPDMQALFHPLRRLGDLPSLRTAGDIARFLREEAHYPLFGKPIDRMGSFGAASIDGYDRETDRLRLISGESVSVERFADEVVAVYGLGGYVLQGRIAQHPDLAAVSGGSVGTVRLVTLRRGTDPEPLYALWKVPRLASTADNFWRSGNMVAALDLESGTVTRVSRGTGLDARELERHPDTGEQLLGRVLPHWQAVKDAAMRAAAITPDLRILGWDIAIGPDGPVIVEGNETPDHVLQQLATGRGVLTEALAADVKAILAENARSAAVLRRQRKLDASALRKRRRRAFIDSIDLLASDGAGPPRA